MVGVKPDELQSDRCSEVREVIPHATVIGIFPKGNAPGAEAGPAVWRYHSRP
jgi:hypothetical protein